MHEIIKDLPVLVYDAGAYFIFVLGAEKYTDRGGGRRAQNWNKNGNTGQVQDLYVG